LNVLDKLYNETFLLRKCKFYTFDSVLSDMMKSLMLMLRFASLGLQWPGLRLGLGITDGLDYKSGHISQKQQFGNLYIHQCECTFLTTAPDYQVQVIQTKNKSMQSLTYA